VTLKRIRNVGDAPRASEAAPRGAAAEHVEGAKRGEEEAMHRLALAILPRIRNGVRYLVRGDHTDDIVQDVLVTVLQRLDSYQGLGRFESWVDGVTLRVVIGRTRAIRSDERRLAPLDADEVLLLHRSERYATSRQLVGALDRLSVPQRESVVLHHVFGLTAKEIAAELATPLETVRSRISAGMEQLRALLGARPGGEP
jgi:RNA polymerase sigma-70 factor (ECF subfamily)